MQPDQDWEIWLDAQISPIIAKWITDYSGYIAKSSYTLGMLKATDFTIYNEAKSAGKVVLISKDADFPELINRLGSPPKLIKINRGNCDNRMLWEFLKPHLLTALNLLINTDTSIVEIE